VGSTSPCPSTYSPLSRSSRSRSCINPIIARIHSVDRVSIIVPWSPNIMIRYFIPSLPPPAPRAHHKVGVVGGFSTSDRGTLCKATTPGRGVDADSAAVVHGAARALAVLAVVEVLGAGMHRPGVLMSGWE